MCVPDVTGKLTPIGNCVISLDRERERVVVTMKPREGINLRHTLDIDKDGIVNIEFWDGGRIPRLHEEITHNGKSVEVMAVQMDQSGTVWVTGDNGERFKYE